jgi:5-oxoprolinase (ATP-hydrolysing) subunit C
MSLVVLEPGIESRIVDLGRPRTRSLGVPVGGAADRRALILGNALVGNPPDAAALEMTLQGPCLRAEVDVGCAIFGAPFDVRCDGYPVEVGRTFTWRTGQELVVGMANQAVRAYLCVRGGLQSPMVLDSRSALEPIRRADLLACASSSIVSRWCPEVQPRFADVVNVAALPGLQASWFDEAEFCVQPFEVTPASNRMGLRLKGKPLTMPSREMTSEPVCPGAVQVTPDGQCIVLGVDGQTIGGYPKIAQVIQADLDVLGQLRPGSAIVFRKITLEEAIERDRRAFAELDEWALRLRLSLDAFPGERRFASS